MVSFKKGDIYRVRMEGYTSDGMGIARIDSLVVFVRGAISGELLDIKLVKLLKNMAYAIIEKIIEASPERRKPACPDYKKCGGCDFMHMSYEEELCAKKTRVDEALSRIAGLDLITDRITGSSDIENYRNKAQYYIGREEEGVRFGFYRARSHDLIPIETCLIQDRRADLCAAALCRWMEKYNTDPYDETKGEGAVRCLQVRTGGAGALPCIISAKKKLKHEAELVEIMRGMYSDICGVVLNYNPKRGNTIMGDESRVLWGQGFLMDTLCGRRFRISPESFYQVNRAQAERLYNKAAEYLELQPGESLLDLYCGAGTVGLCIIGPENRLVGVDIVPQAIRDAHINAEENGISNAEFICADAGSDTVLNLLKSGPEAVVVDPPRKGLSASTVEMLRNNPPKRLVYISCDPATLARDIKLLCKDGRLTAVKAEAFDMFPRCAHVECVVLITRVKD
jgi:23S rRNA (uracil1939-C5)-methyltransferase